MTPKIDLWWVLLGLLLAWIAGGLNAYLMLRGVLRDEIKKLRGED